MKATACLGILLVALSGCGAGSSEPRSAVAPQQTSPQQMPSTTEPGLHLSGDVSIAAIALTLWIIAEVAVRRNWEALLAIPATYLVGVSFGLPLYLFLRSRPVV